MAATPPSDPMRILAVEDEAKTASFIRKALQAEGFAVEKGGLLGVAGPELDVVDALEFERVLAGLRLADGDVRFDCGHQCCLRCGRKVIIARHA